MQDFVTFNKYPLIEFSLLRTTQNVTQWRASALGRRIDSFFFLSFG